MKSTAGSINYRSTIIFVGGVSMENVVAKNRIWGGGPNWNGQIQQVHLFKFTFWLYTLREGMPSGWANWTPQRIANKGSKTPAVVCTFKTLSPHSFSPLSKSKSIHQWSTSGHRHWVTQSKKRSMLYASMTFQHTLPKLSTVHSFLLIQQFPIFFRHLNDLPQIYLNFISQASSAKLFSMNK